MVSDSATDTDFGAIERQAVSVTPLRLDLTHYEQLNEVKSWADSLCANR
jgi:5'-nucleotidase